MSLVFIIQANPINLEDLITRHLKITRTVVAGKLEPFTHFTVIILGEDYRWEAHIHIDLNQTCLAGCDPRLLYFVRSTRTARILDQVVGMSRAQAHYSKR
jgi:hypothetical protein